METTQPCILDLSDYVLVDICEYLSSTDLWQLDRTCKRFHDVVRTKRLWHRIDGRDEPRSEVKVKFLLDRVEDFTEDIRLCASDNTVNVLPQDFPKCLPCANLTVLALENLYLNCEKYTLSSYPETLVELSLRKSYVNFSDKFFKFSYAQMKNLKVLILDHCFWLETNMLVQFSKYPALEVLSMYNCRSMNDLDIAYISLAGCFGFKTLRILDIRFTGFGDQIIKSFYKRQPLTEIYFQNYVTTYNLEKAQRDLDIGRGAPKRKPSYHSQHDDVPILELEAMRAHLGPQHSYGTVKLDNLTDDGSLSFSLLNPVASNYELCSVLYERPYGPCTCSKSKVDGGLPLLRNKGPASKMKGAKKAHIAKLEEQVDLERGRMFSERTAHEITHHRRQPPATATMTPATPENPHFEWAAHRGPQNPFEMALFEHSGETLRGLRDLYNSREPSDRCVWIAADSEAPAPPAEGGPPRAPANNRPTIAVSLNQINVGANRPRGPEGRIPRCIGFKLHMRGLKRGREVVEPSNSSSSDDEQEPAPRRGPAKETREKLRPKKLQAKRSRSETGHESSSYDVIASMNLLSRRRRFGFDAHFPDMVEQYGVGFGVDCRHPSNVSVLSFRGFPGITDRTLVNVMYLNLKLLDVTYTKVTAKGLKAFASVNPKCRLIHQDFCTCRPRFHY